MTAEPPEPELHAGDAGTDPDWHWDGERWQFIGAGAPPDAGPAGEHVDDAGHHWVWDGTTWQPLG